MSTQAEAKQDGGPAFPQSDLSAYGMGPSATGTDGMSLRDWFAGQALAGCLASITTTGPIPNLEKSVAQSAYDYADAMLAARNRSAS